MVPEGRRVLTTAYGCCFSMAATSARVGIAPSLDALSTQPGKTGCKPIAPGCYRFGACQYSWELNKRNGCDCQEHTRRASVPAQAAPDHGLRWSGALTHSIYLGCTY